MKLLKAIKDCILLLIAGLLVDFFRLTLSQEAKKEVFKKLTK